jgi:hypothetical protein
LFSLCKCWACDRGRLTTYLFCRNRIHIMRFGESLRFCLLGLLTLANARGDSPILLFQSVRGPLALSILVPSQIYPSVPFEANVVVERSADEAALSDAEVSFRLIYCPDSRKPTEQEFCSPNDPMAPQPWGGLTYVPGALRSSAERPYYGARMAIPIPGKWELQALVHRDGSTFVITAALPVEGPGQRTEDLLPLVSLPLLLASMFALNQWLRRPRGRS